MSARLVVVGGGNMGRALVDGLLSSGWPPSEVAVVEELAGVRDALVARLPGVAVLPEVPGGTPAVVAVKPADAERACTALAGARTPRVVSIVAGLPTAKLERLLGAGPAVVRAMPNTPARVGAGVTAISGGGSAGEEDLVWAEEVLSAVGAVVRVPESLLDAVTGLSGSGPAYVFLFAEAMIEAGVRNGLAPETSRILTLGTIAGSARMLAETGELPEDLRSAVTSPGGTTEAGVAVLESRNLRQAVSDAVTSAADRSRQLGG